MTYDVIGWDIWKECCMCSPAWWQLELLVWKRLPWKQLERHDEPPSNKTYLREPRRLRNLLSLKKIRIFIKKEVEPNEELLGKLKMLSSVVAQTSETYVDDNQIFFTQLLSNICKGYTSSKSN